MSAGSDVRLNTERIAAAAKAIALLRPARPVASNELLAERALEAADAAGSWNDTERLRTALQKLEATIQFAEDASDDGWRIRLISLHDARVEARRALAASVPSPPTKAQK